MKKQKSICLAALLSAMLLTLCACELNLDKLVIDIHFDTSSKATALSSEFTQPASSDMQPASSDISSADTEQTSAEPADPSSEPPTEPQHDPQHESQPEPVSMPTDPPSEAPAAPSSEAPPAQSSQMQSAPSSDEPTSSETTSDTPEPVLPSAPTITQGINCLPLIDMMAYLQSLTPEQTAQIQTVCAIHPEVFLNDAYAGTYTDPELIAALIELAQEIELGEARETIKKPTETLPLAWGVDMGDSFVYCQTVYLDLDAGYIAKLREYRDGSVYEYEIANYRAIREHFFDLHYKIIG